MTAAGIVEAVGQGVTRFRVGDAVLGAMSMKASGAFAELALADENQLTGKPPELSYEGAATLPTVGVTALQAVIDKGERSQGAMSSARLRDHPILLLDPRPQRLNQHRLAANQRLKLAIARSPSAKAASASRASSAVRTRNHEIGQEWRLDVPTRNWPSAAAPEPALRVATRRFGS
jgi:hypothetical protein